jgi:UDP-3-O-[3-hydroxymyristoyl] N-acetylglucosamine deacetylase
VSRLMSFTKPAIAPSLIGATAPQLQHSMTATAHCSGVGVHSGLPVTLTLHPAPANSGIVFMRTDLPAGQNRIMARWDAVVETQLCTVLGNAHGATIGTVEHILSALHAMNIDNAVIEVDGAEVPIMDGSAAPFIALIEQAGIQQQEAPRRWIEILKPVEVVQSGKWARFEPEARPVYAVTIAFQHPAIMQQHYEHHLAPASFKHEISRARTFGFLTEVEQLRRMGLARGGSLDNAIVLDKARVLNPEGLRYADEFVRHKVLDAVGDLSLAGSPILGQFTGHCTGHALNNALLHALFADAEAWRYVARPVFSSTD